MNDSLRVGIIGLGWAGTVHARTVKEMDGLSLAGVMDPSPERRASTVGAPAVATVEELLRLGVDYCVVAAPTRHHEDIGLQLAKVRVPALIEKPLAHDLRSATRLVDAFEEADVVSAVGHTERHSPAVREMRRLLTEEDFGPIYQITTRRQGPFPARIQDVGVVRDLAIHDIDLIRWLTGDSIHQVSANVGAVSGRGTEDLATVLCRLTHGGLATLDTNWVSPRKERQVTVYTERGCLVADALAGTVTHYLNGAHAHGNRPDGSFPGSSSGLVITYPAQGELPFAAEHRAMRDTLLGQMGPLVTLREGAAAVAVTEAILASARTGTPVTIDNP
ncbi:Gfo/Idh/MocA family oxidoreductase (plasmid) [Nocardiopsis eucommiae]|uniref:Gfo/Idh/MocA family oxidoreductase n=1 Tax=Nocardiopsis eucommiae TaxID=2831970 RepID=A0A975LE38_9ACTN|nr:Gfo/Idh/MocA family oxidoreductase [Nocardiopsis eucommiae]